MKGFLVFAVAACVVFLSVSNSSANSFKKSRTVAPIGFDSMLMYLATGLVDQTVDPVDGPTNCAAFQCDGTWFHSEIMGRDQDKMNYLDGLAKDFYITRFGINVDADVASGRISFGTWSADPRALYRNYINSNRKISSIGSEVRDGGWQVTILDPGGYDLGGEFAGIHVSQGAQALWGNYNIAHRKRNGKIKSEEIIWYRAGSFFVPNELFEILAICELTREGPEFINGSQGFAQIAAKFHFPSATEIKFSIRNVLTFGDSSPLPGLGPDELLTPFWHTQP